MIPETVKKQLTIRNCSLEDHLAVISVMKDWWGGRDLEYALPKLFFDHFNDSSFVVHHREKLVGFLIGFLSQSHSNQGYIHFIGIHPSFRKIGLGSHLYSLFFKHCRQCNRHVIKSRTSPVNQGSIHFHLKLGFKIEPGDTVINGIHVHRNYNRDGDDKVLFVRTI